MDKRLSPSPAPAFSRVTALGSALLALTVTTTGCSLAFFIPRYLPDPSVDEVEREELLGTWEGWNDSTITLAEDGTAEFSTLDGSWFGFDEGWRLTGTGTWEIHETENVGPKVKVEGVEITDEVEVFDDHWLRLPKGHDWRTEEPEFQSWNFGLDRKWGELRMWLHMSDPDIREYNWFERVDGP